MRTSKVLDEDLKSSRKLREQGGGGPKIKGPHPLHRRPIHISPGGYFAGAIWGLLPQDGLIRSITGLVFLPLSG